MLYEDHTIFLPYIIPSRCKSIKTSQLDTPQHKKKYSKVILPQTRDFPELSDHTSLTEECNHYLSLAPWMFGAESPLALVANPPLPLLLLSGIKQEIKRIPAHWNSHLVSLCSG
jgi:hypothetical protein